MTSESPTDRPPMGADRRRLRIAIRTSLREVITQLSLLNRQVGNHLDLNEIDVGCLELIGRHGPLSPSALARHSRLHPATLTGILDRLERGGWIARDRDPADRRGVVVRALRDRSAELLRLYAGMNHSLEQILGDYTDTELQVLADFLSRTAAAGGDATGDLAAE
ncbi:MAG TPA: MarR family transcriptional regulator [Jiangellaceae bacterium]|nr:MarR family transcriptional regulator [Jiangellaceae bacterium]